MPAVIFQLLGAVEAVGLKSVILHWYVLEVTVPPKGHAEEQVSSMLRSEFLPVNLQGQYLLMCKKERKKNKASVVLQLSFYGIQLFACLVHSIKCEITGPLENTVLFG